MIKFNVLGATGSIGSQTLDIIRENQNFCLDAFSFGYNFIKAKEIIDEFKPKMVCSILKEDKEKLEKLYPTINFVYGVDGLNKVATFNQNKVVNALVGSSGVMPTYEAVKNKQDIYLANKETLVVAGKIIMDLVKQNKTKLYPLDSEHSAIFQLLTSKNQTQIERLILTASGGALRDLKREDLKNVTKEQVLNHPNWKMGEKITVDSATMMNKGFEVIEAHHLFDVPVDKIDVVIQRSSIIHSLVEFNDYSICAQLASQDMHLPINYALNDKNHQKCDKIKRLDFENIKSLEFEKVDSIRFPLINLAKAVQKKGGIYPCILNASNEQAVMLFLNGKIKFIDIERIIKEELENKMYEEYNFKPLSIELLLQIDEMVKNHIQRKEG